MSFQSFLKMWVDPVKWRPAKSLWSMHCLTISGGLPYRIYS